MNKFETVDIAELSAVVGGKKKKGGHYNQYATWKCGVGVAAGGILGGLSGNPAAIAGGMFTGYAKFCS